MIAGLADVEHGIEVGSLSAAGEYGAYAPFEGCYFGCHGIVGWILQACVEIAFFLQVEEHGHFLGVIILESGALDDGEHAGVTVLGLPSCLHTKCGCL